MIDGGEKVAVTIKGERYEFGALEVGQLPAFARAIRPMGEAVSAILDGGQFTLGTLLDMMADHGEHVIEAVALATGIPVAVINKAKPDELLPAVRGAFEVNRDFFLRRLMPALRAALKPASPGAGPTP